MPRQLFRKGRSSKVLPRRRKPRGRGAVGPADAQVRERWRPGMVKLLDLLKGSDTPSEDLSVCRKCRPYTSAML